MNVRELIEDLSKMPPYLPVKVVLTEIYGCNNEQGEFVDDRQIRLSFDDAIEADAVRHEGKHILIVSK